MACRAGDAVKHRDIAYADHHFVAIAPVLFGNVPDFSQMDERVVVPAGSAGFALITAIAMGPVWLEVLPAVDPGEWPEHDAIEVELGEPLVAHEPTYDIGDPDRAYPGGFFVPDQPGRYRVDVYAKRREKDWDTVVRHARRKKLERYAVVFTLLDAHPVPHIERQPEPEPEVVEDAGGRPVQRHATVLPRKRSGEGSLVFYVGDNGEELGDPS